MAQVLILSGAGSYADPWHPFPATSAALAQVAQGVSEAVSVREDVDAALAEFADPGRELPRILVVNTGDSWRGDEPALSVGADSIAGFNRLLDAGVHIFGTHTAAASLRSYPRYAHTLGGMWVPGSSWHPPKSATRITLTPGHAATQGVAHIDTVDERYTDLQLLDDVLVLATQTEGGREHPVLWCKQGPGGGQVVYSALGHDAQGYESREYQQVLRQIFTWLLAQ